MNFSIKQIAIQYMPLSQVISNNNLSKKYVCKRVPDFNNEQNVTLSELLSDVDNCFEISIYS